MSTRSLLPFFALTFAVSWGIPGLALLAGRHFGFSVSLDMYTPLYFVGVWGPAIAALTLVARQRGIRGVRLLLRQMLDWRFGWKWWGFALLVLPATYLAGALLLSASGRPAVLGWYEGSWLVLAGGVLLRATAGPVEEIGWRGFALPLLQRRFGAWPAIGLLAVAHTLWHVPVFVVGRFAHFGADVPLGLALLQFFANILFLTIILSIAYNASGGSLALAFLIHWVANGIFPWEGTAHAFTGQVIAMGALVGVMLLTSRRRLHAAHLHTRVLPPPAATPHRSRDAPLAV